MNLSQERIGEILNNIRDEKSYYVGGSLCVDNVLEDGGILLLNLDGTARDFTKSDTEVDLTLENSLKLFTIYKEVKGETDYFKKCLPDNLALLF